MGEQDRYCGQYGVCGCPSPCERAWVFCREHRLAGVGPTDKELLDQARALVRRAAIDSGDTTLSYHVHKWDDERASSSGEKVCCLDCGGAYSELMAMSLLIPKSQWLQIHPDDGGVLCANCMLRRAEKLGAINITGRITFAADYDDEATPYTVETLRVDVGKLRAAATDLLGALSEFDKMRIISWTGPAARLRALLTPANGNIATTEPGVSPETTKSTEDPT